MTESTPAKKLYRLRIDETRTAIYEIEAESAQDAFDRFLSEGEFID